MISDYFIQFLSPKTTITISTELGEINAIKSAPTSFGRRAKMVSEDARAGRRRSKGKEAKEKREEVSNLDDV